MYTLSCCIWISQGYYSVANYGSYNIFFEAVAGNPEEERDTITKMTMALWNHTDGRETKTLSKSLV